jgi:predicted DNA-binding transcriptional regulator AlpA
MLEVSTILRHHVVSDDSKYLSVGQVRIRYGWSNSTIARRLRSGFPAPVRLGGKTCARRWLLANLQEWEARQSFASDGSPQPHGARDRDATAPRKD